MNTKELSQPNSKNTQQGAVLMTSMILLLVMTMIGLTGMQVTTLEEKMAGNMRDRNLAFQSAESALRAGEAVLTLAALPVFSNNGANGLYARGSAATILTDITNTASWAAANTVTYSGGSLANIATMPEYIIEQMPLVDGGGSSLDGSTFTTSEFFTVTARGTGGTTSAVVIAQSVYKR